MQSRNRRWGRWCVGLAGALLAVGGCSANHKAVFKDHDFDAKKPGLVSVDSKQRVILFGEARTPFLAETLDGTKTRGYVQVPAFCVEPSPDVFSVIAQALSGAASGEADVISKAVKGTVTGTWSSAEQGSTIPRTQTVNLLRELMYRTCERYLNGGIGADELKIQAMRDQNLMVSVLAIEQLTGAVAARPTVIGAMAQGEAGASAAAAVVVLNDAFEAVTEAQAAEDKYQAAYNTLNSEDECTKEDSSKPEECVQAKEKWTNAKSARVRLEDHYKQLKRVADSGGTPVVARGELMNPVADGGIARAHTESVSAVANTVREIVRDTFEQNEILLVCGSDPEKAHCQEYLNAVTIPRAQARGATRH